MTCQGWNRMGQLIFLSIKTIFRWTAVQKSLSETKMAYFINMMKLDIEMIGSFLFISFWAGLLIVNVFFLFTHRNYFLDGWTCMNGWMEKCFDTKKWARRFSPSTLFHQYSYIILKRCNILSRLFHDDLCTIFLNLTNIHIIVSEIRDIVKSLCFRLNPMNVTFSCQTHTIDFSTVAHHAHLVDIQCACHLLSQFIFLSGKDNMIMRF